MPRASSACAPPPRSQLSRSLGPALPSASASSPPSPFGAGRRGGAHHASPRLLRDGLRQAGRLQVAPRVLHSLDGGTWGAREGGGVRAACTARPVESTSPLLARGDEGEEVLQPQLRLERRAQLGEPVPCGRRWCGQCSKGWPRACRRGGCSGGACRGGGLPAGGRHSVGELRAPVEPRESVLLWGEARGVARGVAGAGGGAHSPSRTTAGLGRRLGGEARPSPGGTR